MTDSRNHWDQAYSNKPTDRLGWFKPALETSLAWIKQLELAPDAPIIDVGGGASTLVDDLLGLGYRALTVLDISQRALELARQRLGAQSAAVDWLNADITSVDLPVSRFELWHDRAVFHFLTTPEQRSGYLRALLSALRPAGHVIIGTFAPDAPPRCSGLPVQRYTRDQLAAEFGDEFKLLRHHEELHITPGGVEQMYLYCHFRRLAEADNPVG